MNKIYDRWNKNGIIKKLSKLKEIFVEPKDNRELPRVMKEYRSVIEESSSRSFRVACGAILFAVFRGKVAEGIDFSDNQARCVLAVSDILNSRLILFTYSHACIYIYSIQF